MRKGEKMGYPGRIKKIGTVLLAFLISVVFLFSSVLAAEIRRTRLVKVAVLNNTTYASQDANGVWSGMDIECMINISQRAGFDVEFIDSGKDADFLGNLENGVYDIVADVVKTPDRENRFLFTDEAMGSTNNTLAVRSDDNRWDFGNIDQISYMKIGVIATYANNADFRAWCEKHSISPEIHEYENFDEMTKALQNGDIDGEVYTATYGAAYAEQYRPILKFLPESYYFTFRKDDIGLKNKVDSALAQILSENEDYLVSIKNKYETRFNNNILPLSYAENKYIAEHPQITVAVSESDQPFYKKDKSGADGGIIPDYYKLIADWAGVRFQYKVCKTNDDAIAAVKRGEADIAGMYRSGLISAYQEGLLLTDNITTVNCILLTNPGANVSDIENVAVVGSQVPALEGSINQLFPNARITGHENAQECFSAMSGKKTDAMIIGMPGATWLINQTNSTAYSITPIQGVTYDACGAVKKSDQMLCTILNKGIAATRGNFASIMTRNTLPQNDWKTTISRIPPMMIIGVVSVLLALVIGLAWSIVMLRRRQKERAAVLTAQSEAEQQRIRAEASEKNAEEKNAFFSNISHDMRTPLNAVIGFAGLGENEKSEEKKNEYFSKIRSSGELLNSLIDDTLTVSKISSGKLELHPEPTDTADLFSETVNSIRQAAADKKITFTADTTGKQDRTVMMDRLSVQKICLNLLSNAIKYTPEGGHVSFRLFNIPPDGEDPDSVIEVKDDGIGISEEFLPRIFEPFTQEKRHGYESVGTGLGLSIVKQLVDMMHGTIEVKSKKNVGTTFTVRLHFEKADGEKKTGKQESAPADFDLNGKKVLLCEDNALNREIAVELLKKEGLKVITAEDGQDGLQKFTASGEGEFDAILMDLRMPVMDGYAAARAIRALNRKDAKTVPIIAMTADAFADDIRKCMDAGMNAHIAKPVNIGKLYQILSENVK